MNCMRCGLMIEKPAVGVVGVHPTESECIAALVRYVVQLESKLPHVAERTQCVNCSYIWVTVGPLFNDGDGAQCPRCNRHTGAPMYPEGN